MSKSYYRLPEVFQKIDNGQVLITANALYEAYRIFGWGFSDIKSAYKKLRPKFFYKSDVSDNNLGLCLDFYKATIYDEKIYTHFYIDDASGVLVINSFHEQW